MLIATFDDETGIVCTTADALVSIDEFDRYLATLPRLFARSRDRHGIALHLIEAANNPIQLKETASAIADTVQRNDAGRIRCAYIVHSALARMQIQRLSSCEQNYFMDRASGMTWLLGQRERLVGAAA